MQISFHKFHFTIPVQVISAVHMNGSTGEWFRTTVAVRAGWLVCPTLFNSFLVRIMSDALEEHDGRLA